MKVDLNRFVRDVNGQAAMEGRPPLADGTPQPPIPLTFKALVMHALNGPCGEAEKMPRYVVQKLIADSPSGIVELTEAQPEIIRKAAVATVPPYFYGQLCELLGLA